jgi:hypothetical protein
MSAKAKIRAYFIVVALATVFTYIKFPQPPSFPVNRQAAVATVPGTVAVAPPLGETYRLNPVVDFVTRVLVSAFFVGIFALFVAWFVGTVVG